MNPASLVIQNIQILGMPYTVQFEVGSKTHYRLDHAQYLLTIFSPQRYHKQPKAVIKAALRTYAEKYLKHQLAVLAHTCNLRYNRCVVKDHVSKWGSCSSKKNINLNWHLIMLRQSAIEYVLIHELMHLHELNHSSKFWGWVKKYCPNYQNEIDYLKQQSWVIHFFRG